MAIVWILLSYAWASKPHALSELRSVYLVTGALWFLLLLLCVLSHFSIWWDLDASGLTEHRLFSARTIPWPELTRVGPWTPGNKPIKGMVEVAYHRSAPMSASGHLLLQPGKGQHEGLLAQLHQYAPQATFVSC